MTNSYGVKAQTEMKHERKLCLRHTAQTLRERKKEKKKEKKRASLEKRRGGRRLVVINYRKANA